MSQVKSPMQLDRQQRRRMTQPHTKSNPPSVFGGTRMAAEPPSAHTGMCAWSVTVSTGRQTVRARRGAGEVPSRLGRPIGGSLAPKLGVAEQTELCEQAVQIEQTDHMHALLISAVLNNIVVPYIVPPRLPCSPSILIVGQTSEAEELIYSGPEEVTDFYSREDLALVGGSGRWQGSYPYTGDLLHLEAC